ncbi:hypothetical protein D3C74_51510 [compost metagenome]
MARLTATELNKLGSGLEEKQTIQVLGKYDVTIHTKLRNTGIQRVLSVYLELLQGLKAANKLDDEMIAGTLNVLYTLILREFTDLPLPKKNDLTPLLRATSNLIDTGIMEEVFQHIPDSELMKVKDQMSKVQSNMAEALAEMAIVQDSHQNTDHAEAKQPH